MYVVYCMRIHKREMILTRETLERRVLGERITEFIKFSYPPIIDHKEASAVIDHFLKRSHTIEEIRVAYDDVKKV